jgi:hypothetical protein
VKAVGYSWIILMGFSVCTYGRDFSTADAQFTICKFRVFQECRLLTPAIAEGADFTSSERNTLSKLRELTGADSLDVRKFTEAFGQPTQILHPPPDILGPEGLILMWLTESKEVCPLCGIRLSLQGKKLLMIDFDVNDKFMVVWQRAGAKDIQ